MVFSELSSLSINFFIQQLLFQRAGMVFYYIDIKLLSWSFYYKRLLFYFSSLLKVITFQWTFICIYLFAQISVFFKCRFLEDELLNWRIWKLILFILIKVPFRKNVQLSHTVFLWILPFLSLLRDSEKGISYLYFT